MSERTCELYASTAAVGMLKGFSPLPHQLAVDVVVPHQEDGLPGFGEFLLIELSATEALVGRVCRYHAAGQLTSLQGDSYLADLAKTQQGIPAAIKRQMLRYNLMMQLLGHIECVQGRFRFSVGQRTFATLGANVRLPSDAALAFLCNVGLEDDPTAALLGHLAYGQRVLESVPIRFSVGRLKSRRTFVFARAGYGKSNLIKYLVSRLYSSPPDVGLLIFDPEGEYALPDALGRPGLVNVPALRDRVSLYTSRSVPAEFRQFKKGEATVNFGDFPPQDIVAAFVPAAKQETIFANMLRSLDWTVWKSLVALLAQEGFAADDNKIGNLLRYKPRKDDWSISAIKNNLVPAIRRLHLDDSVLSRNIIEELRQNRVVIVDISLLGSEDGLAVSSMLLRRIFQHNIRHLTDAGGPMVRCLAVIEEAQTVLGDRHMDDANVFVRWVKEGRKYGLGAIMVTQQPGAISDQIISQGDNFFALHLLNDRDLQTLQRHNAYYTDDILNVLRAEPIKGNCYFWSAPDQPFVLPARVCNFETHAAQAMKPTAAKPKVADRPTSADVAQAVGDALVADSQVWLYPVARLGGKASNGWVALSADYLQRAVAQRVKADTEWLQNLLPREIEAALQHHKARRGYAVLAGVNRRVWAIPLAELKLSKGKSVRPESVEITGKL